MAWGNDLALAYWKAQAAAGSRLPDQGTVYLHAGPRRMESLLPAVRELKQLGFDLVADAATSAYLESQGIATGTMDEAAAAQAIERGEIQLLVSLPDPGQTPRPGRALRERAIRFGVPLYTTGFGAHLAAQAITAWRKRGGWQVRSMQKRYKERARERAREMRRLSLHGFEPGGMPLIPSVVAQEPLPGPQPSPKPA